MSTETALAPGGIRLWHNADWVRLWSGNAATVLGSSMAAVAMPLVAYALTHSVGAASVVVSTETVTYLVAGPVGGLVADRTDRRRVIVAADAVGLVAYGLLALALCVGVDGLWPLLVVAAVTGARQGFSSPAHQAAVRRVVGPSHVPTALAHQQAASTGAQTVGPRSVALCTPQARSSPSSSSPARMPRTWCWCCGSGRRST